MVPECFRCYYEDVCVHKPAFYLLCSTDNGAVDRSLTSIDTNAACVLLLCTYALGTRPFFFAFHQVPPAFALEWPCVLNVIDSSEEHSVSLSQSP